jgi:sortase A
MAYIFTPLVFMIIGYAIAAVIFSPFLEFIHAAGGLLIGSERPDFAPLELQSVFDEEAADDMAISVATVEDIDEDGDVVIHISEITLPHYGQHYAELRNRRIGLQAPVYFGDNYEILRVGVGHNINSLLPGFGGTMLLAGHNTSDFLPFQDITVGDVVEFQTNYGHFEYEVARMEVFHRDEAASHIDFVQIEEELLVMYTCYPFDVIGRTPYRLFVFAEKISGPVIDIFARE